MKRILVLAVLSMIAVVATTAAQQPKKFGIGIILGAPTGFSFKYWDSPKYAIQGAVGGWGGGITIGADYTIHSNAFNNSQLPFYYGPGAFLGSAGFGWARVNRGDVALGGRFIFGVDYIFAGDPFDIAFEIGPALLLAPDVDLGMEVGIAFRFYP